MRSLNVSELELWCGEATLLLHGAQLQETWFDGHLWVCQFYRFQEHYLVVDLTQTSPRIWLTSKAPPKKKQTKPFILFVQAHFKNLFLDAVTLQKEWGRVLHLSFLGQGATQHLIELRLIPRAVNICLSNGEKSLSFLRVRTLQSAQTESFPPAADFSFASWNEAQSQPTGAVPKPEGGSGSEQAQARAIAKKLQAIAQLEAEQQVSHKAQLIAEGNRLLSSGEIKQAEQFFNRAKQEVIKKESRTQAIAKLKIEIARLQERRELRSPPSPGSGGDEPGNRLKLRQLILGDDKVFQYGKSASDNVSLLRKAKAWHFWIHLRDEPGSYGILARKKEQKVAEQELFECALWMLKSQHKYSRWQGTKVALVVAECRYVKPIKGAKLGLVQYTHERVFSIDCP